MSSDQPICGRIGVLGLGEEGDNIDPHRPYSY